MPFLKSVRGAKKLCVKGIIVGHVGGEKVLVLRRGRGLFKREGVACIEAIGGRRGRF